jgi:hypothetical protein
MITKIRNPSLLSGKAKNMKSLQRWLRSLHSMAFFAQYGLLA